MKSSDDLRLNPAALAAAQRTFGERRPLPLEPAPASDPRQIGRERLKGAFQIDVSRIRPDPSQPRREFEAAALAELAASLRERGVLQPIRVWYVANEDLYQVIAGERRYRAALAAGLTSLPCLVEDQPGAEQERQWRLLDQIVENWQRADLQPWELSDALFLLRDEHGLSQEELSRLTGKPKSEISRLLSIQKIAPAVQQQVRGESQGQFSRRHLVAVAQLPEEQQPKLVEQVRQGQLTAIETERAAAKLKPREARSKPMRGPGAVRRYAVSGATVELKFLKREVADSDVLSALDRVRQMVESQAISTTGD